jgi:serine/threonine-protein kinase
MHDRHGHRIVSSGLAAAGTLVVVVTVAVLFASTSRPASVQTNGMGTEGSPTAVTPTAVVSGTVIPTEARTPSPQSSGPSTPASESVVPASSSHPRADPIANLRLSIQQQVDTGNLNPLSADDLYPKVDGIAQALSAGKSGDVSHKTQDFRNTLVSLVNGGQLTAAGYAVLSSNLDAITQA